MKNAIVTGANSGIGYATAELLKKSGYDVLITGRNKQTVPEAAKALSAQYCVADMADIAALESLAQRYLESGLDCLVLNAASAMFKSVEETTMADFDDYMNINIKGNYFLIKALQPALQKRGGSICIVTSAIVDNGLANASLYAITKGAMDAMTKSLAAEFKGNIRINAVAPGAIDTPILYKLGVPEEQIKANMKKREQLVPMGRYGQPEEIAHVVVSQLQSTYTTGTTWCVDGGVDAV